MESGRDETSNGDVDHLQPQNPTASEPVGVPQDSGAEGRRGAFSDPTSRRRFLRATVAAGAVVGAVATAGGIAFAADGPQILNSLHAGTATPSGHCVKITEGCKGGSNPNDYIQVSTCDFLTYIGTIDGYTSNGVKHDNCDPTKGTGTVFVITHPVAVLVDKNGHLDNVTLCLTSATYKAHNDKGHISLFCNPFTFTKNGKATNETDPEGSCLYVNQTATSC